MTEAGPIMNLGSDRTESRRRGRNGCRSRHLAGVLALSLILGGCSAVPDWADPSDWFERDQAPTRVGLSQSQAASAPSASFPNLASVPDAPPRVTPSATRAEIQAGLAADRANARYSGEQLVGGSPPPAPSLGAAAPAPQAASGHLRVPKPPAGAPAAPKIAGELGGGATAPSSSAPAPTQAAQTQVVQTQVAQAGTAQTQLRFPQFQGAQIQGGAAAAIMPGPAAAGAHLVAVIYFGHGSARLDANDRGVLRDIVALHRQRGGAIRVVGHASAHTGVVDQIRHRMANFEMSLKRANAVAAGLVALGVAEEEVRAEARGDAQPVFHEFMPTGEAGNRRTEIFLEY
jgi:outer membrane protein OmpA-like peptidoglycan-associated protein